MYRENPIRVKHEGRVTSFEGKHIKECVRFFFCSLKFSFAAFKMFDEEKASNGDPRNMDFVLKAMQRQFDRFNLVFGEMRDMMDR